MRTSVIVGLFLICGLSFFAFGALRQQTGRTLRAAPSTMTNVRRLPSHDHGIVDALGSYVHTFRLRNDTEDVWTVKEAKAECGCTKVTDCSTTIAPGDELAFTVELSPKGERYGPVSEDCHVVLLPGPVFVTATVSAVIAAQPRLNPSVLDVQVPRGQARFDGEVQLILPLTVETPEVDASIVDADIEIAASIGAPDWQAGERASSLHVTGRMPDDSSSLRSRAVIGVQMPSGDRLEFPLEVVVSRQPSFRHAPSAVVLLAGNEVPLSRSEIHVLEYAGTMEELEVFCSPPDALSHRLDATRRSVVIERMALPRAVLCIRSADGYSASIPVTRIEEDEKR